MRRRFWAMGLVALFGLLVFLGGCRGREATPPSQPSGTTEAGEAGKAVPGGEKPTVQALTFGTSSVGSTYYTMSVGMADILTRETGINVTVEPRGGANPNVLALKDKKIDMAMLTSLAVYHGYLGIEQFAKEGKIPLRVIMQGQKSLRNIVVRNASGIKTPADLKGKKFIGIRPAATDVEMVTYALLDAYGIPRDSLQILQSTETNETIEALKIGTADGAIIQAGVGAGNLMELAQSTDVTFLSIPDEKLNLMLQKLGPAFCKGVIPAGTYKGQTADVQVPAVTTVIAVREDMPEDLAYTLTKALMDNLDKIAAIHSVGKEWTIQSTLEPPPAPFHPGAIKYFRERGVWTSELDNIQTELLKM